MASNSDETNTTTTSMKLKLMVDVKENKVVFAEAGEDFVDFIFHLITLPLAAISKLLNTEPMMQVESTNLRGLYQSIDSINPNCFQPNLDKDSLLSPKTAIAVPFFSFFDFPTTCLQFYACDQYRGCFHVTDCAGIICPTHHREMSLGLSSLSKDKCVAPTASKMLTHTTTNYVKSDTKYLVTDKMEVKPFTISFVISLLKNLDLNYLEELQVQLSPQQGLAIVKAVVENRNVLTSVFLQKKVKEEVNYS